MPVDVLKKPATVEGAPREVSKIRSIVDDTVEGGLRLARRLVVQANNYILTAQKDNRYDLKGHAERARQLLVQANEELKLAAEAANAGNAEPRKEVDFNPARSDRVT
jgi:hypothetical protein